VIRHVTPAGEENPDTGGRFRLAIFFFFLSRAERVVPRLRAPLVVFANDSLSLNRL